MQSFRPRNTLILLTFLLPATALAQQGTGKLYEVTTRMEMAGMPMAMPAQSMRVCGPAEGSNEKMVPTQGDCKMTDQKTVGNTFSFRMACSGKDGMNGEGEFEHFADGYRGRIAATSGSGADRAEFKMNFEGKLIGECDYATEGAEAVGRRMQAQHDARMAANQAEMDARCKGAIGELRQLRFGDSMQYGMAQGMCAKFKQDYCNTLNDLTANQDFVIRALPVGGFGEATNMCGKPVARLKTDACRQADPREHGEFVAKQCPAEAKPLAQQHCAGRGYTAMMSSPYREFCSHFASGNLQQRNAGMPGGNTPAGAAMNVMQQGANLGVANGSSNAAAAARTLNAGSAMMGAAQSGGDAADKTLDAVEQGAYLMGGRDAGKIGAAAGLLKGAKSLKGMFGRDKKAKEEDAQE